MIKNKINNIRVIVKIIMVLVFILANTVNSFGQVRVPFSARTSSQAPSPYKGVSTYNVQGDFKMIGNTNLTLVSYSDNAANDNMMYVDVDRDVNTLNSSSAFLELSGSTCDEIVYAGLYWSGRAHDANTSSNTFSVTKSVINPGAAINLNNQQVSYNSSSSSSTNRLSTYTNYRFNDVTRLGGNNTRYPRYRIQGSGLTTYYFQITNDTNNRVQVSTSTSGPWTTLPSTYTNGTATLTTPYEIDVNYVKLQITGFVRDESTNSSTSNYESLARINYNVSGNQNGSNINVTKNYDKRKVQLKKAGGTYQEITALNNAIYYPPSNNNVDGVMYSAYADVTNYVRANGVGEYFVADIALNEGDGGNTGFYGGWGMVVVYKNSSMKWRDITVFDGHAYVQGSTIISHELPISGFKAAQKGDVKVTMGMMAGEGDVSIPGDYFEIRNAANSNWLRLSHSGNSTSNFFNSSIVTEGNTRNPNLLNNTGLDIVRFDLDNNNNSIIANNATNTRFRYGSTQDTYVIYNIVFAVDAYVPEVVGENSPGTNNPGTGNTVDPGQGLEFDLNLYNKGTEAINNLVVDIPIPFNLHYDGSTIVPGTHATVKIPNNTYVEWIKPAWAPSTATPQHYPGGTLRWTVGNLPLDPDRDILQGTLKYKFKVTSNCALLSTAGPCGLKINVNGTISGVGATSGVAVSARLVRDYAAGNCSGAIYDDFESTIAVSQQFIQDCTPPPVENDMLQFKAFCSLPGNAFPRTDIAGKYPLGTKFFSSVPPNYDSTTDVVSGNFPVNTDGSKRTFYAVVPGMDAGCYIRLQTSLTLVTTQPTVQNVSACQGTPMVLQNALSPTGVSNGYQLYYFNSASATVPLSSVPNPTAVATHNYWVAEGTSVSGTLCIGPKVPFTVTINTQPVVQQNVGNISICENNDAQITINVSGVTTYMWQYTTAAAPTVWNTLNNTTFSGQVMVNNAVLNISHATPALNGVKVRLKATNSNNCENTSNHVSIEIKNCGAITNPMLPNKAKKQ